MIQGLHLATQGMTLLMQKQDQVANNLANSQTTGFKQSGLFAQAFQKYLADDQLKPNVNREIKADEVYIDYSEGPMRKTGNSLDTMIKGSGFFTLMTPNGIAYSRNGNFSLDHEGYLVTSDGYRVMSTEGFFRFNDTASITISEQGEVLQGTESKGFLRITDFEKPYRMIRQGNSCLKPEVPDNPPLPSSGYAIKQGFLEGSNVNLIRNMVQMIAIQKNYEADQKALHAQDETLDKAVNQVGRVG